jgi:hypothetical protein
MGEAKRKKSATQKFIQDNPICCFCGGARHATTREHMPPKAMFDGSHRPDKLVMPACDRCNRETSTADLTASIISRWGYLLTDKEHKDHQRLVHQMRKQAPSVIDEWKKAIDPIGARAHLENHGVFVPRDAGLVSIGPLTIHQLNQFAHKFVLGLYFEHFREILPDSGRISSFWRTKEDFGRTGIPQQLLDMMRRYGTLEQGRWNTREIFEYRYELNEDDGLFACLGRFRGNLFITGFAAHDGEQLLQQDADRLWIQPSYLLQILSDPLFDDRP